MNVSLEEGALCQHLPWDSAFFGFSIARLNPTHLSDETARAALAWCKREGVRCLYFLADALDASTGRIAHQHDFQFVDVRITLETKLGAKRPASNAIRPFQPDDLPALETIARKSYHDSRFYFDGKFPPQRCDDMYALWVARDAGRHDLISNATMVATDPEIAEPAGFMTSQLRSEADGTATGILYLMGVDERVQGRGYGGGLIAASMDWFDARGAGRAKIVTQGRNIASLRAHGRFGFLPVQTEIWYHRWFE